MATTLAELKQFLDDTGLKFDAHDEHDAIVLGFSCEPDETTYRDRDGDPSVQIVARLVENGELLMLFAPRAWRVAGKKHRGAVCEAATRIQAKMKLIRFDLDDDHLQPNIEIPLEQAPMCAQQLHRAIAGVLLAVRRYDAVIRHAMETGKIDFTREMEDKPEPQANIAQIIDLANGAGGLDAIERLLGGGDAPPVTS